MHVIERIPGQRKEQVKQFLSEKLKINSRETYSVQGINRAESGQIRLQNCRHNPEGSYSAA